MMFFPVRWSSDAIPFGNGGRVPPAGPLTVTATKTMKLTIERAALLKALSHVQSVVERRNTIPILSNVLLAGRGRQSCRSTATDMDLEIVEAVPAPIESQTGGTTAPAHTLYDIVRKLPEGAQVELEDRRRGHEIGAALRPLDLHPRLPADEDYPQMAGGELPHGFRCRRPSWHASSTAPASPSRPRRRAIT